MTDTAIRPETTDAADPRLGEALKVALDGPYHAARQAARDTPRRRPRHTGGVAGRGDAGGVILPNLVATRVVVVPSPRARRP